jgi:hypothetical protein
MTEQSDRETRDLEEFERTHGNRRLPEPEPMTKIGDVGDMAFYRNLAYPYTPAQEAEIDREHRASRKKAADDHRAAGIGFAVRALEGKCGHEIQEMAEGIFRSVEKIDLVDQMAFATPENVSSLVLWDLKRRASWLAARARGDYVPAQLKTREECLAIYNARKRADERFEDRQTSLADMPPMAALGKSLPEQGSFSDHWWDK